MGWTWPRVVENGGTLEPDLLYRALPYLIDPEWTRATTSRCATSSRASAADPGM